jgi:hypothetical protein
MAMAIMMMVVTVFHGLPRLRAAAQSGPTKSRRREFPARVRF